jgi:acyl-coenzyme A synthetase/AMP-(fatty) acid ligase
MEELFIKHNEEIAFIENGLTITYGETNGQIEKIKVFLEQEFEQGEEIAICMSMSVLCIEAAFAAILSGLNVYLLYPRCSSSVIEKLAGECGVPFLVDHESNSWLRNMDNSKNYKLAILEEILTKNNAESFVPKNMESSRKPGKFIFSTSGTTSSDKKYVAIPFEWIMKKSQMLSETLSISSEDINLLFSPICFIQTVWTVLIHLIKGAKICIYDFQLKAINEAIKNNNITTIITTPSVIRGVIDTLEGPHNLRLIGTGGDYMDSITLRKMCLKLPNVLYSNIYGCTETSAGNIILTPRKLDGNDKTIYSLGKASCDSDIAILNDKNDTSTNFEEGRIFIKTAFMEKFYYKSKKTVSNDNGYFCTNDIGYLDKDGYIYYIGRGSGIIVYNGQKISSFEVENILYELEAVKETVVIGQKHHLYGQIPICFVVLNSEITEEEIKAHLLKRLEKYKVPRQINIVPFLPKTQSNKVIRYSEAYNKEFILQNINN